MIPFTSHWKSGFDPPFTGVAVYVMVCPWQGGVAEAAMLTLTGKVGRTEIVIVLEIAGFPIVQASFDVSLQDTRSPLAGT